MRGSSKKNLSCVFLLVLVLSLSACDTNGDSASEKFSGELGERAAVEITFSGLAGADAVLTIQEIVELPSVTREIVRMQDDEEVSFEVTGPLLKEVYSNLGAVIDGRTVRFVARDGYAVKVPHEILEGQEIVLAYAIDGELLDERSEPLRAYIIPDGVASPDAAMYWVKHLKEIVLVSVTGNITTDVLWFLETAAGQVEVHSYDYTEDRNLAVKTKDLLSKFVPDPVGNVYIFAADGLEKQEDLEIFQAHYIVIAGKSQPEFTGPDLPRGMQVKEILWFNCTSNSFFSLEQGINTMALAERGGKEGIPMEKFLEELSLNQAGKYLLEAYDGYSVEIEAEDLSKGVVYLVDGEVSVSFDELPRSKHVKGLLGLKCLE